METYCLRYRHTNNYLIKGKDGFLLFDCDWAGSLPKLWKALKNIGLSIGSISHLLISHYHPDHAGTAEDLKDLCIPLIVMDVQQNYLHIQDALYEKAHEASFKPISEKGNLYWTCDSSREALAELGIPGEILHTPGHSEDSISLIVDEIGVFHGDLPPYAQLEGYENPRMERSWASIMRYQPRQAFSGHWPPVQISQQAEKARIA